MGDYYNWEGEDLAILNPRISKALVSLAAIVTSITVILGASAALLKPYIATADEIKAVRGQVMQNTTNIQKTTEAVHNLHKSVIEGRIDEYQDKIDEILVIPESERNTIDRRKLVKLLSKKEKLERKLNI